MRVPNTDIFLCTYSLVQVLFEKAQLYGQDNFWNRKMRCIIVVFDFLFKIGVEVDNSIKICYDNQSDRKFKLFQKDFKNVKSHKYVVKKTTLSHLYQFHLYQSYALTCNS